MIDTRRSRFCCGRSLLTLVPLVAGATVSLSGTAQADVVIVNGGLTVGVGRSHLEHSQPRYSQPGYIHFNSAPPVYTNQIYPNRIERSILINPIVVGAPIENSQLINPVIVRPSRQGAIVIRQYGFPERTPQQDNPACTMFRSLRPACQ